MEKYKRQFSENIPLMPIQKDAIGKSKYDKLQKLALEFYKNIDESLSASQSDSLINDLQESIRELRKIRGKNGSLQK